MIYRVRTNRSKSLMALVAVAAMLVSAQLAFAATADDRFQTWNDSFEQFMERHSDLTVEESTVVWQALDMASPELFGDWIDSKHRNALADQLSAVRATLSCADWDEVRTDLLVMSDWLDANEVALLAGDCYCTKIIIADTPDDTAPGNPDEAEEVDEAKPTVIEFGCADGWVCDNSISCTSREGTTHNGRCRRE